MTHPEQAGRPGGRPWPAPGPDANWWRAEDAPEPEVVDFNGHDDEAEDLGAVDPDEVEGAQVGEAEEVREVGGVDDPAPPERPAEAGPYDRPPRRPARPDPPGPVRRESGRVAWVTDPVPVAPPPAPAEPAPALTEPAPSPDEPALTPDVPSAAPPPGATAPVPIVVPAQRRPPATRVRPLPARRRRRRRLPRRPWLGLPALVVLAIATTFFAWVSAEPFWLAVGHGRSGTATIIAAATPAEGCRAIFIADDGSFIASDVDLRGLGPTDCARGAKVAARMVSPRAEQAYATTASGLHLRWLTGLGLVLLCALAIVWLTGAARFDGWRRGVAVGLSLAGPAAITVAMLTAAF